MGISDTSSSSISAPLRIPTKAHLWVTRQSQLIILALSESSITQYKHSHDYDPTRGTNNLTIYLKAQGISDSRERRASHSNIYLLLLGDVVMYQIERLENLVLEAK